MITPATSAPELLALHAIRLKGMADDGQVAARFDLDLAVVGDLLLDFQAYGWISRVEFAGTAGWTLTESGRSHNERQLSDELIMTGTRPRIDEAYQRFLPHNAELLRACTDWQLRPTGTDPLAVNDHTDADWDRQVLAGLSELRGALGVLAGHLACLERFDGYDRRFATALGRVEAGERAWVTRPGIDSCHTVWMELHEDLIATLGLQRGG